MNVKINNLSAVLFVIGSVIFAMGLNIENLGNTVLMLSDYTIMMYFPLIENNIQKLEERALEKMSSNTLSYNLNVSDLEWLTRFHYGGSSHEDKNRIDFLYESKTQADELIFKGKIYQYIGISLIGTGVVVFIHNMILKKR